MWGRLAACATVAKRRRCGRVIFLSAKFSMSMKTSAKSKKRLRVWRNGLLSWFLHVNQHSGLIEWREPQLAAAASAAVILRQCQEVYKIWRKGFLSLDERDGLK
jgi:hypothetical protein